MLVNNILLILNYWSSFISEVHKEEILEHYLYSNLWSSLLKYLSLRYVGSMKVLAVLKPACWWTLHRHTAMSLNEHSSDVAQAFFRHQCCSATGENKTGRKLECEGGAWRNKEELMHFSGQRLYKFSFKVICSIQAFFLSSDLSKLDFGQNPE